MHPDIPTRQESKRAPPTSQSATQILAVTLMFGAPVGFVSSFSSFVDRFPLLFYCNLFLVHSKILMCVVLLTSFDSRGVAAVARFVSHHNSCFIAFRRSIFVQSNSVF